MGCSTGVGCGGQAAIVRIVDEVAVNSVTSGVAARLEVVDAGWISPETVEACTMRSRYARDTEEVRSGVPGGCGPHRPGYRQADRPGCPRPRGQCGHPGQLGCQGPRRT